MSAESHQLLVASGDGWSYAIRSFPSDGRLVVEDLVERRTLGDLSGDVMPFAVTILGVPHILFAGEVFGARADMVEISSPNATGIQQACAVKNDVWMSSPEPFERCSSIVARWRTGDQVHLELGATLELDALEPLFGPGWTFYAPLRAGPSPGAVV